MKRIYRYKNVDGVIMKKIISIALIIVVLTGCGTGKQETNDAVISSILTESATDSFVYFPDLKAENEDIFAWLYVPGTGIDHPILQSSVGDDNFYKDHNALGNPDANGALYIEAANLANMCDFNEVVHGNTLRDGGMFTELNQFLDRSFFEEHQYIYVYMEENVLVYVVTAAYQRNNTRLVSDYDFSYAYGCQEFIDEIKAGKGMGKNIRKDWEEELTPESFLITLSTLDTTGTGKQTVVVGVLAADMNGLIDRVVDYGESE